MRIATIFTVLMMGLGLAGCKGDPCKELAKELCGDQSAACDTFFSEEFTGPNGQALNSDLMGEACKMILEDGAVLEAYKKQFAKKQAAK